MPQPANLTIHLLCMHDKDRDAYLAAAARSPPPAFASPVTMHSCALAQLPPSAVLYAEHRGWANPGSCTRVPVPAAFAPPRSRNVWGVRHLLLCPTMRVPESVVWDKEVVYQCVWSMLCAVDRYNQSVGQDDAGDRIESILMTPLATGVGRVSEHVWAAQLLLALRHYDMAIRNPDEFSALDVDRILTLDAEIQATYEANLRENKA
ncbi:hypothetical protein CRV24_006961 [Beauveria bassiana]|nr:hypothetical protein CRV24_006961 [Beauveria bassiana]